MNPDTSDSDFERLVRRALSDVAAATPDPMTDPEPDRRSSARSVWLRAAAVLLVVAGVVGLVVGQRQSNDPVADQPAPTPDPVAHLYVLPGDTDGLVLSNGGVYTARPDQAEGPAQLQVGFLIGTTLQDGVVADLVHVTTSEALPFGFGARGTTEIDTPTGAAVVDDSFVYRLAQQRGDVWLFLTASEESPEVIEALSQISVSPDGAARLEDGPLVVIDRFERNSDAVDYTTYYEITDAATGTGFVVETATSSSVMALGAVSYDTAQPISLGSTPAWLASRNGDSPDGSNTAVVWQATPNRIVAISAHAQPDVVTSMAEKLQQVSPEQWFEALPDAVTED